MSELSFNLESFFLQNSALWGQEEAVATQKIMDAMQGDIRGRARSLPNRMDARMGTPSQLPLPRGWLAPERDYPLHLPATHWWGCAYYNVRII